MSKAGFDFRAISDAGQIEVLASPIRQELVDTLFALGGEASVADLAEHLGRHADGLYYHLRMLRDAGLVGEVKATRDRKRTFRLAGGGRAPLRLAYRTGARGNVQALMIYVAGLLQVAGRDFEQGLQIPGVALEGKRRQLWAARNKGWVSAAELEEINALLERLCELTSHPRDTRRRLLTSCSFVLSPVAARPRRRAVKTTRS
jgi:DNA-binding transcriptional ArsR family regulator